MPVRAGGNGVLREAMMRARPLRKPIWRCLRDTGPGRAWGMECAIAGSRNGGCWVFIETGSWVRLITPRPELVPLTIEALLTCDMLFIAAICFSKSRTYPSGGADVSIRVTATADALCNT